MEAALERLRDISGVLFSFSSCRLRLASNDTTFDATTTRGAAMESSSTAYHVTLTRKCPGLCARGYIRTEVHDPEGWESRIRQSTYSRAARPPQTASGIG